MRFEDHDQCARYALTMLLMDDDEESLRLLDETITTRLEEHHVASVVTSELSRTPNATSEFEAAFDEEQRLAFQSAALILLRKIATSENLLDTFLGMVERPPLDG